MTYMSVVFCAISVIFSRQRIYTLPYVQNECTIANKILFPKMNYEKIRTLGSYFSYKYYFFVLSIYSCDMSHPLNER